MTGHATHLTDDELAAAVNRPRPEHLAGCGICQSRLARWQRVADGVRVVSEELDAGPVPSFDSLLGRLPAPAAEPVVVVAGPGLSASWRLVGMLTAFQLRLLPRSLAPLSVAGLVVAVLIALSTAGTPVSTTLFGLVVALVIQIGALAACSGRTDPRTELAAGLPIPPAVVFADRVLVVLAADAVLALAASAIVTDLGGSGGFGEVVAAWLGPALLASAVGVVVAVWRAPGAGAAAGLLVWLLGALGTVPDGGILQRVGAVIVPLWSTGPAGILVAVALLLLAVPGMNRTPPAGAGGVAT